MHQEESGTTRLKEELRNRKVLLIDDEYKAAGWKGTLECILGSRIEATGDPSWETARDVLNDAEVEARLAPLPGKCLLPYDLILLDLRLANEDKNIDGVREADKFSGIQLLKRIREKDPTVPVILFTASNKAYNIKEAEKLNINAYFPKEVHYNFEEAANYYLRFKELIQKFLSSEQKVLREVWNGIQFYRSNMGDRGTEKEIKILSFLENAYHLSSAYFQSSNPVYLKLVIIELGNVVEVLYGRKHRFINKYSADNMVESINNASADSRGLHACIVYKLRGSAAHPYSHVTFEDTLFTYIAIFRALKIYSALSAAKRKDPCSGWIFNLNVVEDMITSICGNVCNKLKPCYSYRVGNEKCTCRPSEEKNLNKAKFLSLEHNLRSEVAENNQIFFRYLLYALCLKEMGEKIPESMLPLLKARITCGGKFCPPFKDNSWIGIKMDDGSIDSPLGRLKKGAWAPSPGDQAGDKVYFLPTKRYLERS